jgi:methionyl-tRNA formyltransferase
MRVVFMGSPEFAVPILQALARAHQVVGVVTQPDRPAGRGRALTPPPVKQAAHILGIQVIQPERLSTPDATRSVSEWAPDVIIVAAYGQILRSEILGLPRHGCLNIHASLLPRWRGAAPVQAALRAGDPVTGITIMRMDAGMDTGGILAQVSLPIEASDTGVSLTARLAPLGASLLLDTLPGYLRGDLLPAPQDEGHVTLAPLLKKEDGRLDFALSAVELDRQVRAYDPWPGTFLEWDGARVAILHTSVSDASEAAIGAVTRLGAYPAIGTAQGLLILERVRPAGRQPISGDAFLRGTPAFANARVDVRAGSR